MPTNYKKLGISGGQLLNCPLTDPLGTQCPILITSTQRNLMKKSFKVCLSKMDNQNSRNFIIVDDCVDMDECIEHIHSTERGWVIDSIKQI